MSLKIATRSVGDVTILDLSGKNDIGVGSVQLREAVRAALESGKKKLLLNMEAVSYTDSSGIGELVSSYTTTTNQGGQLKLLNLTPKLRDILMITQLLVIFQAYDNEKEAIDSFK